MEVGSDLFNILITGGFFVFVFICVYLIYAIFRSNKLKHELKHIKSFTSFKISVSEEIAQKGNEPQKNYQEEISVAEQFFGSLSNLYEGSIEKKLYNDQMPISLEIIAWEGKMEFFCICPSEIASILERQINSFWPTAQIAKEKLPNIFKINDGAMASAYLKLDKKFILPIRTYKNLESDSLNSLTNSLSKLGENSGAAIQVIVKPITDDWRKMGAINAKKVQEGKSITSTKWYMKVLGFIFEMLSNVFHGGQDSKKASSNPYDDMVRLTPIQEQTLKALNEKVSKTALATNVRVVATALTDREATLNLKNITTSFGQFSSPELNRFKIKKGNGENIRDYILRRFSGKGMILNTEELASIYHFPSHYVATPNIAWSRAKEMPPPANLPQEGTILGKSVYRGEEQMVRIKPEDRRRHIFMIGKTGVGKTTLFANAIEQDVREGKGCCYIDPLGDAIEDLLGKIPQERWQDVILFDPADTQFPLGLNLMEFKNPEERDFLIQETIQIFYKLFDPGQTGIVGPQWEHWFRNAALSIMAQPGGGTLIDIPRIFTDDAYRTKLVSYVTDPIVKSFWEQQLAKTADFHKSEMYNYFISKFGRFMTNDLMRNIIGQKKSSFDIREAMDNGKIILINLSKGKIGEVNSALLGMIIVSKIQMAAFSRADITEEQRRDFYLYVDEFQNFTTDSFATILSEARKYHLNLNVTNQYIAQLTEHIRDAVIGNAGTLISYRIGASDAEFLAKEFPGVTESDFTNIDKYNTYVKLLIDGTPSKPFSMKGIKSPTNSDSNIREQVRNINRQTYGRPLIEVEAEISESLKVGQRPPAAGSNGPINNL